MALFCVAVFFLLLDVYIGPRQLWNPTELCHSNAGQRNNLHRLQRLCVLSQRYLTLFQGKMQECIFILFSSDLPLFTQQHSIMKLIFGEIPYIYSRLDHTFLNWTSDVVGTDKAERCQVSVNQTQHCPISESLV